MIIFAVAVCVLVALTGLHVVTTEEWAAHSRALRRRLAARPKRNAGRHSRSQP